MGINILNEWYELSKGDVILIDRWNDGNPQEYKVSRVCKRYMNVKNEKEYWAMPYNRHKDIIEVKTNSHE